MLDFWPSSACLSPMITAPRSALLKGHCWSASSLLNVGSDMLAVSPWIQYMGSQEDDLKMLNKDFSCGGLDLQNPRFLGGGWVDLFITPRMCVTFGIAKNVLGCIQVWAIQAWHTRHCNTGVQGEVYQADLLGIGTVAVKISRRNDDYAKGDLVARFESFEGVWHWPYSYLTPSDWIQMVFFWWHANSVWLLYWMMPFLCFWSMHQRWNGVGSPFPLGAFPLQKPRWSNCWMTHWSMLTANINCQIYTLFQNLAMYVVYNCTACLALNVFVKYN